MTYRITLASGLCVLAACASGPQPTEHLAASMAAVRGAETAGAGNVPQAELHLKLAQEQIQNAQQMIRDGDNERADAMTIRAYNDAELAIALAREAQLKREVEEYAAAHPEVKAQGAPATPQYDATNPPGVGAPNNPPSSAAQ
jgi:pyridoxal biosynthesis lyase PdxS